MFLETESAAILGLGLPINLALGRVIFLLPFSLIEQSGERGLRVRDVSESPGWNEAQLRLLPRAAVPEFVLFIFKWKIPCARRVSMPDKASLETRQGEKKPNTSWSPLKPSAAGAHGKQKHWAVLTAAGTQPPREAAAQPFKESSASGFS